MLVPRKRREEQAHQWPCRYKHINPYGKYAFEVSEDVGGDGLRPLGPGRSPA
jgi:hypothetical protein